MRSSKLHAVISAFLLTGALFPATARAQDDIAAPRLVYEQELERIEEEYAAASEKWPREYLRELEVLQNSRQQAGDLEGWKTARDEITRFEGAWEISAADVVERPDRLRTLQAKYRGADRSCVIKRLTDILEARSSYVAKLDRIKKNLTMAGSMDQALKVHEEIERLNSSPEITAAEFELAAYRVEQGESGNDSALPPPQRAPEKTRTTPMGAVIYAPGERPPLEQKLRYQRGVLWPTRHSPNARPVTVRYMAGSAKGHLTSSLLSRTPSPSTAYVRLALRSTSAGDVLHDVTVVVTYCTYGAGRKLPREQPLFLMSQDIHLGAVDDRSIYVDCAPVPMGKNWFYDDMAVQARHRRFCGVIVSVLLGDGSLAFQGMSDRALDQLATIPRRS